MQKKTTLFCKALRISHTEIANLLATPVTAYTVPIVRFSYNTLIEAVTGLMSCHHTC